MHVGRARQRVCESVWGALSLSRCIRDAWLLPLCFPAGKELFCNCRRHGWEQLGGTRNVGVRLWADRARSHFALLLALPSKPVAQASHLALKGHKRLVWLSDCRRMNGSCLFNTRLLLHAFKLLRLKALFSVIAKHALPHAARVALSRGQAAILLLDKFMHHIVWDAILGGRLGNKNVIHLLRPNHF